MANSLKPIAPSDDSMENMRQRTQRLAAEITAESVNGDMRRRLVEELFIIIGELRNKRDDANYRQLVLSFDQLFDVVRALNQMPASLLAIAPTMTVLCDLIEKRGWRVQDVMENMLAGLLNDKDVPR